MKKIAIFQTDLNYGGIQKSLLNLLNNIDYEKYKIDLYLTNDDNVYIKDLNKNVNVLYLKKLPFLTRIVYFDILKRFYKNQIDKKYDVAIDFNSYSMDTALATLFAKAAKKVVWVHNDIDIKLKEEKKYRVLYKHFKAKYKYFDDFVAVSNGAMKSFKKYHKYKNKNYHIIPNLIDTNEIVEKSNLSSELSVDKNKYNFCSVGRLEHQKGFDILLNDIKKLTQKRKDFHLYIIGDGNEKYNLIKQINDLDITSFVTLTGYAKNPYSIMKKMDGFVLTSRYEGQGMVFLEAKCLGLDIIMPKHLEIYVDGIKGINDIVIGMERVKKHKKYIDYLNDYNEEIIRKINILFDK